MFRNLLLLVGLFFLPFFSFAKSGVSCLRPELHNLSLRHLPSERCTDEDQKEHTSFLQQPAVGITQGCRTNSNLIIYVVKHGLALPLTIGFLNCSHRKDSHFSSSYLFAIYPTHNFW